MATKNPTDIDPRIERTRRVVLEAAAELVAESGWDMTTIEGVSERCGVARSTIYRHWPDRSELLADAIKSGMQSLAEVDTGSLRSDLLEFLGDLVGWLESNHGATVALHMLTVAHRDPAVMKMHREATRSRRDAVTELIDRAKERGELPPDVNLNDAANDLLGVFFFKKMMVYEQVDAAFAESRVDRWLDQVGWKHVVS